MKYKLEHGYFKKGNKYYAIIECKEDGMVSLEEDNKALSKIKKAKSFAKKLKDSLDKEAVLIEAIMRLEDKEFKVLEKMLGSKKKYKVKTREHHCVDMKVGNFILPIIND